MKHELLEEQFSETFVSKVKDRIKELKYIAREVNVCNLFTVINTALRWFDSYFDCETSRPYLTDSTDDVYKITFGVETPDYSMTIELVITVKDKIFKDFNYSLTKTLTYKNE